MEKYFSIKEKGTMEQKSSLASKTRKRWDENNNLQFRTEEQWNKNILAFRARDR